MMEPRGRVAGLDSRTGYQQASDRDTCSSQRPSVLGHARIFRSRHVDGIGAILAMSQRPVAMDKGVVVPSCLLSIDSDTGAAVQRPEARHGTGGTKERAAPNVTQTLDTLDIISLCTRANA
jgi:hypothetical protein